MFIYLFSLFYKLEIKLCLFRYILYYFECDAGNSIIVFPPDVVRVYVDDVADLWQMQAVR